ncbi:MAG: hypothetical protein RLZZ611_1788 [Cyanobacteriota bacterium]
MQTSEENRAEELRSLGWSAEDVRRYADLWDYRQRWGAINLEREDRAFLRKAEAALPRRLSGKGSEKKRTRDKSHYRWLAFHLQAMQAAAAGLDLQAGEQAAWPILLEEELRVLDYYEPVLGLPDTLKARELVAFREQWISRAASQGRVLDFDFLAPLEALKQRETTSWKPLRGDGNGDSSYPVLDADSAAGFRAELRQAIAAEIRRLFPSLQDSDKPAPADDWQAPAAG